MDLLHNKNEILLYGTVGAVDLFDGGGFTALDVQDALNRIGRRNKAIVRINSGGGYTDEGMAIFSILDGHPGGVDVIVDSIAASAASLIAMAGQQIIMRPGTEMMIHDPANITIGNSKEHQKAVESLEATANSMAEIYALRNNSRKTPTQARNDMKEEIWMTAQEAVQMGYADRIERARGSAQSPTAFDYGLYSKAPKRLVAMATSKGWKFDGAKLAKRKGTSTMNVNEMTPAEKTEFDAAVALEVTKKVAEREKATKDAADAAAAAAEKVRKDAEEAKKTTATAADAGDAAVTAERQRAADIVAACELAGYADKATAFIAEGKALRDVVAELRKLPPKSAEVSGRNAGAGNQTEEQKQAAAKGWKKAVDRVNARIPG